MHADLVKEIVAICERRLKEGDCPTIDAPAKEVLEDCIIQLAADVRSARQDTLETLGEAFKKFSPDLAAELSTRWLAAKDRQGKALDEMLAALRSRSQKGKKDE